jgi:hypothetical protein
MTRVGESYVERTYLGENVVRENEYLSAMMSVKAGIDVVESPEADVCRQRLMEFGNVGQGERLSCCRW